MNHTVKRACHLCYGGYRPYSRSGSINRSSGYCPVIRGQNQFSNGADSGRARPCRSRMPASRARTTADSWAPPSWAEVTRSDRGGRGRACRHDRQWADSADRRHSSWAGSIAAETEHEAGAKLRYVLAHHAKETSCRRPRRRALAVTRAVRNVVLKHGEQPSAEVVADQKRVPGSLSSRGEIADRVDGGSYRAQGFGRPPQQDQPPRPSWSQRPGLL